MKVLASGVSSRAPPPTLLTHFLNLRRGVSPGGGGVPPPSGERGVSSPERVGVSGGSPARPKFRSFLLFGVVEFWWCLKLGPNPMCTFGKSVAVHRGHNSTRSPGTIGVRGGWRSGVMRTGEGVDNQPVLV